MKVAAITLRKGMIVDYNDKLWMVTESEIRQPGKGASVIQVEMRDVNAGNKTNVRFATQDMVERARIDDLEFQFLYANGDEYTFMNNESFEQMVLNRELIGEQAAFLQDGMMVKIQIYEGKALSVSLPETVIMEIVEADPVVKGQTASSSYKPAKLANGVRVMVPPHIGTGTRIVIKTEDLSYVERARD